MEPTIFDTTVVSILVMGVIGFLGWLVRRKFSQVDNHEIEIQRLKESSVTADQVRSIIHQSNESIRSDMAIIRSDLLANTHSMNLVLQQLAKKEGYDEAMKELREKNGN